MTAQPIQIKKSILVGSIVLVLLSAATGPIVYVLLGEKHTESFLLGIFTGAVNMLLLLVLGRLLFAGGSMRPKTRKGLIFLLILKYPLLFALLFWGLYVL